MRLTTIDGLRGIFLLFMMIFHANDVLQTTVGKLNHHYFGWVEDAQGFVFMSGLVVGLVYGRRYILNGHADMSRAIWKRIRTIYSHQVFLILLFLCVALSLAALARDVPAIVSQYAEDPVAFPLLSAGLVTGSRHMGILPMYIFFMMVTPLVFRFLHQGSYLTVAAMTGGFWMLAQTRLPDLFVSAAESALANAGSSLSLGIYFNIFGWQALFFGGLTVGYLMASRRLKLDFLWSRDLRGVFLVCFCLFLFFGIYDRIVFSDWFGSSYSRTVMAEADRGNFSTIYAVTFAVDLLLVVWLLGPGQTDRNPVVRQGARLLKRIVTLRPLVFLGQHSLHVFTAHVIIYYALAVAYQAGPPEEAIGTVLLLLSVAGLFGMAGLHAWSVKRSKAPAPRMPTGPIPPPSGTAPRAAGPERMPLPDSIAPVPHLR